LHGKMPNSVEIESVDVGNAVTERFALKTKYFYAEHSVD